MQRAARWWMIFKNTAAASDKYQIVIRDHKMWAVVFSVCGTSVVFGFFFMYN